MKAGDKIKLSQSGEGQEYVTSVDPDGIPVTNTGRRLEPNVAMNLSDILDEMHAIVYRVWIAALDAKGMEHEFAVVEDYERAYDKYKREVLAEAKEQILQQVKESLPEEFASSDDYCGGYNACLREIKDRLKGER